jgi:hypothetical protein
MPENKAGRVRNHPCFREFFCFHEILILIYNDGEVPMKQTFFVILFFLLLLSACATPTQVPPTSTSEPTLTRMPTLTALPSATITSSAEPTNTPTPTPEPPNGSPTPAIPLVISPDGKDIQCYFGPGVEYTPTFAFKMAEIIGKDQAGLWWYVQTYDKLAKPIYCWVNAKNVRIAGGLSNVLITEAERGSVTAINISIVGNSTQEIACGQDTTLLEFHFTGEMTTNGSVDKLRYQWMTDAGTKFSAEQTQIRAWDAPARVEISIPVPAQEATYSLTLRTIFPNEMVQTAQFTVKCR